VYLPAFRLSATPLRWLGYLIADPQQAAVPGTDPVLVNVPSPGRFAVYKLWTSRTRPATFQVKAREDLLQAEEVLEVLVEDRSDDLREAWETLPNARLRRTARGALGSLPDGLAARIRTIVGE